MTVVHINRGLGPVIVRRTEDAGVRWCFRAGCRAHLPHTWELHDYDVEVTYYDPWWVCVCSRCGEDHTAFPGREWTFPA